MSLTDTFSREANAQHRSKVEILSKVENNRPYSKYDRKIIVVFKK